MNKWIWIIPVLVFLGIFLIFYLPLPVGCSKDAKICPDGSIVGRIGIVCRFEACPSIQSCGSELANPCPKGYWCYQFPDSERSKLLGRESPICFRPNIALCPSACGSGDCDVLESSPMQIKCK